MKTIQEIKDMLSRSEGEEALTAANEIVNDKATNRPTALPPRPTATSRNS